MEASAPAQKSPLTFLKGAGAVSKLAVGLGAAAMGVAFVASLVPVGFIFGGIALYAGGKQAYEGGKTLFGKNDQPAEKPGIGKRLLKAAESAGIGFTGMLAFSIGGFALGMGSTAALPALLVLGGTALMAAGAVQLGAQAFTAIRDTVQHVKAKNASKSPSLPAAPDLSPAPKVGTLEAQPGFEKAASPEAKVEAPAPAPANVPPAPRP